MKAGVMATRLSVLTRALPSRILVVEDDAQDRELITRRLTAAGFEVRHASHGQEALDMLERHWYPLVITDWHMPVMDGLALTRELRARGADDTYVIMWTMRDASTDFEQGYLAGVDDYLTKKVSDPELFARIYAAFNTLALRRSLREAQEAVLEQSVSIDVESGAFSPSELQARLLSEIRRGQRYGRQLAVLTLGVRVAGEPADDCAPDAGTLKEVVQAIDATVRAHVDWIGRLESPVGAVFAVVLPEAGIIEAPLIKERMMAALTRYAETAAAPLAFSYGVAALERDGNGGAPVDAAEMLNVAEHCRHCPGHSGHEQLAAVQRSVATHAGIVCRHGYVVDSQCMLKSPAPMRAPQPVAVGKNATR
ncbi:response regulator [Steroidobacter sp. S1-65]|uniref:Response regulator n=1 Tax=Steroidobacter gossypii TaxID=2805490 RepID=A0ABS1X581_9GAMM|nr:response regulator [Steroidobacter gossypii]MBM0108376.1 response regulator [Steroidobacter gossypii]